jgi:hypothetical protein
LSKKKTKDAKFHPTPEQGGEGGREMRVAKKRKTLKLFFIGEIFWIVASRETLLNGSSLYR